MTQTNPEQWAVELWETAFQAACTDRPHDHTAAALAIQAAFAEREETAHFERRNIISHATMGSTTGEGMSVNAICVEITRQRNKIYQAGKDASAEREARLVGALGIVGKVLPSAAGLDDAPDSKIIACYMSMGELRDIKEALAALKDRTHG